MKIRYLFIIASFFLLFLVTFKEVCAFTSPPLRSLEVLVQNKTEISEEYPIVSGIEARVLGKSFSDEDIYKRLDRLETALFGAPSKKSLSDRVEAISKAVIGSNDNYREDDDYSSSSHEESLKNLLGKLEKELLNQVYPNDTVEARVARLENNIFNKSSEDYPMEERIDRITAVVKAKPSSEIIQDMNQLRNYQMIGQGLSLAALILMIIAGLAL